MVVPCLRSHLYRHKYTERADYSTGRAAIFEHILLEQISNGCHSQTYPNGKSIERASISIVALTRLHRSLVEVDDDGKSCHKEKEEDHPELLYTLVSIASVCCLDTLLYLPEESYQTQYER